MTKVNAFSLQVIQIATMQSDSKAPRPYPSRQPPMQPSWESYAVVNSVLVVVVSSLTIAIQRSPSAGLDYFLTVVPLCLVLSFPIALAVRAIGARLQKNRAEAPRPRSSPATKSGPASPRRR